MRIVLQRVSEAKVKIDDATTGQIKQGYVILLGIVEEDSKEDITWLVNKIINLRIFSDPDGKINLSIKEIDGEILVISQFTLFASTKKGNRPSFIKSAKPDVAIPLYNQFVVKLNDCIEKEVQTGEFGADMQVSLTNDGPVTIIIDSKNKE
jgi:D-tyrosyl-tRNA(Tyr) deacylase